MLQLYENYQRNIGAVDKAIQMIADLSPVNCIDPIYLEKEFIPKLGLNNESLHEQPVELSDFFGTGLHLWQYPSQLAHYLVWLTHNAKNVRNYTEIGCRWGGTFILVNEWLKKIGTSLDFSLAIDPIEPTPFLKRYIELSSTPVHYIQDFSTSSRVKDYLNNFKQDMVFVDGDHSLQGVMHDHMLVRKTAKIIVHHDVMSDACPDTTLFWNYVKVSEDKFHAYEFCNQYESVKGNYLGIGVLDRFK
jgi:cephalosporin hydroxylase